MPGQRERCRCRSQAPRCNTRTLCSPAHRRGRCVPLKALLRRTIPDRHGGGRTRQGQAPPDPTPGQRCAASRRAIVSNVGSFRHASACPFFGIGGLARSASMRVRLDFSQSGVPGRFASAQTAKRCAPNLSIKSGRSSWAGRAPTRGNCPFGSSRSLDLEFARSWRKEKQNA